MRLVSCRILEADNSCDDAGEAPCILADGTFVDEEQDGEDSEGDNDGDGDVDSDDGKAESRRTCVFNFCSWCWCRSSSDSRLESDLSTYLRRERESVVRKANLFIKIICGSRP